MNIDLSKAKIYLKPGATDMRKHINTLSALIEEEMGRSPLDGSLFLFCGKSRRQIKILYWERNGFCLWQKRLEKDRFPWPKTGNETREITGERLVMLLDGIDFFHAHETLHFFEAS